MKSFETLFSKILQYIHNKFILPKIQLILTHPTRNSMTQLTLNTQYQTSSCWEEQFSSFIVGYIRKTRLLFLLSSYSFILMYICLHFLGLQRFQSEISWVEQFSSLIVGYIKKTPYFSSCLLILLIHSNVKSFGCFGCDNFKRSNKNQFRLIKLS